MKKLITSLCLIVTLAFGSFGVGWSGDHLQKGFKALTKGDYATALKELTPFAEKGDVHAQYYLGFLYDIGDGVPHVFNDAV